MNYKLKIIAHKRNVGELQKHVCLLHIPQPSPLVCELITRHRAFPRDKGDEREYLTEFTLHKILEIWIELTVSQQCCKAVQAKGEGVQYCAKVMQVKCANFVLCSCDFSKEIHWKVHMKFHGISSDNLLEQRPIFLHSFVQLKKICEHK